MSSLEQIASDLARAQAQLVRTLEETGAWKDDQRARLERDRLEPLMTAASAYSVELREAVAAVRAAERLLS
jgi:hypothetical protein